MCQPELNSCLFTHLFWRGITNATIALNGRDMIARCQPVDYCIGIYTCHRKFASGFALFGTEQKRSIMALRTYASRKVSYQPVLKLMNFV
jgi:hypothetical protein